MASLRRVITAVAVGITLLLAGCAQTDPAGQPTYSCTPDDGSSPYACYKVQYDAKAKEAAQYAEAEAVYRKFFAEQERIYRAGGVTQPTPVLLETTTGNFLTGSMANFTELARYKGTATGGAFNLVWVRRAPISGRSGAIAALQACTDSSSVTMKADGEPSTPGKISSEIAYFTRDGDTLKAFDFDVVKVTKC